MTIEVETMTTSRKEVGSCFQKERRRIFIGGRWRDRTTVLEKESTIFRHRQKLRHRNHKHLLNVTCSSGVIFCRLPVNNAMSSFTTNFVTPSDSISHSYVAMTDDEVIDNQLVWSFTNRIPLSYVAHNSSSSNACISFIGTN